MNHVKRQRGAFRRLCLLSGSLCVTAGSVHAATLEHKWRAGEQLSYDLAVDGTMTIETDANAPILFAGIPLDVKILGGADVLLDTREVTPDGAATIAVTLPQLKLKGTAWEQVATLDAKQGNVGITFNGRGMGKDTRAPWLVEPPYALQVSKNAHIERVISLTEKPEDAAKEEIPKQDDPLKEQAASVPAPAAPPIGNRLPLNVAGLMRSLALQVLPTLWPGRDVAPGETWSIESRLPVPSRKADGPALEMMSLGKFELTLGNEEDYAGHRAYKVAIQGLLSLDKNKAARLNNGQGTRLINAAQKLGGSLWFDAAAGQLVGADLKLTGNMAGIIAMPARNPGDTPVPFAASQRFDGSIKLQLKSAKMKDAPLAALPEIN